MIFFDQPLFHYKFHGSDMWGMYFFIFATCEPLTEFVHVIFCQTFFINKIFIIIFRFSTYNSFWCTNKSTVDGSMVLEVNELPIFRFFFKLFNNYIVTTMCSILTAWYWSRRILQLSHFSNMLQLPLWNAQRVIWSNVQGIFSPPTRHMVIQMWVSRSRYYTNHSVSIWLFLLFADIWSADRWC